MGQCQQIHGLVLDKYSDDMLRKISKLGFFKKAIDSAAIAGTFNALFTKSGPKSASFNINQQDWHFLFDALKANGPLFKGIEQNRIDSAIVHYMMRNNPNEYKLIQFWEGLSNGCKY